MNINLETIHRMLLRKDTWEDNGTAICLKEWPHLQLRYDKGVNGLKIVGPVVILLDRKDQKSLWDNVRAVYDELNKANIAMLDMALTKWDEEFRALAAERKKAAKAEKRAATPASPSPVLIG